MFKYKCSDIDLFRSLFSCYNFIFYSKFYILFLKYTVADLADFADFFKQD